MKFDEFLEKYCENQANKMAHDMNWADELCEEPVKNHKRSRWGPAPVDERFALWKDITEEPWKYDETDCKVIDVEVTKTHPEEIKSYWHKATLKKQNDAAHIIQYTWMSVRWAFRKQRRDRRAAIVLDDVNVAIASSKAKKVLISTFNAEFAKVFLRPIPKPEYDFSYQEMEHLESLLRGMF
jgi:hypothetical protein